MFRRRRLLFLAPAAILAVLAATGSASAASGSGSNGTMRPLQADMQDDCDPATFNAVLGDGACVGDGGTTFAELVERLEEKGAHGKWRFTPRETTVEAGTPVHVTNSGGEFHTWTPVENFGGGCIPDPVLNAGQPPVPECQPEVAPGVPLAFVTTGVPAGGSRTFPAPTGAVQRYECLIHPWMRATVHVES